MDFNHLPTVALSVEEDFADILLVDIVIVLHGSRREDVSIDAIEGDIEIPLVPKHAHRGRLDGGIGLSGRVECRAEFGDYGGMPLKIAGNPVKLSAHADPDTRSPAPALDSGRASILAEFRPSPAGQRKAP